MSTMMYPLIGPSRLLRFYREPCNKTIQLNAIHTYPFNINTSINIDFALISHQDTSYDSRYNIFLISEAYDENEKARNSEEELQRKVYTAFYQKPNHLKNFHIF